MVNLQIDTEAQARRREAAQNAKAIVAFSDGTSDPEMEALDERYIAGELTSEQVIAEIIRQAR